MVGKYKNIIFDSETKTGAAKIASIKRKNLDSAIIFATGCFDVAHSGHPIFTEQLRIIGKKVAEKLRKAKTLVVVGVGRDSTLRKLKGKGRPVNPEWNRAYQMASYKEVDYVILDNEEIGVGKINFGKTIELLKPDVFVLNYDDSGIDAKRKLCKSSGIIFRTVKRIVPSFLEPTSSTKIIQKL